MANIDLCLALMGFSSINYDERIGINLVVQDFYDLHPPRFTGIFHSMVFYDIKKNTF
jgi:hypothetical protein